MIYVYVKRCLVLSFFFIFLNGCDSRACCKWHYEKRYVAEKREVLYLFGKDLFQPLATSGYEYTEFVCDEWCEK
jgi:hypothetical protein